MGSYELHPDIKTVHMVEKGCLHEQIDQVIGKLYVGDIKDNVFMIAKGQVTISRQDENIKKVNRYSLRDTGEILEPIEGQEEVVYELQLLIGNNDKKSIRENLKNNNHDVTFAGVSKFSDERKYIDNKLFTDSLSDLGLNVLECVFVK